MRVTAELYMAFRFSVGGSWRLVCEHALIDWFQGGNGPAYDQEEYFGPVEKRV